MLLSLARICYIYKHIDVEQAFERGKNDYSGLEFVDVCIIGV